MGMKCSCVSEVHMEEHGGAWGSCIIMEKQGGGADKNGWTPSPKVVELDESIPKHVLTFFFANWEKNKKYTGGQRGGGEGGGCPGKDKFRKTL